MTTYLRWMLHLYGRELTSTLRTVGLGLLLGLPVALPFYVWRYDWSAGASNDLLQLETAVLVALPYFTVEAVRFVHWRRR